MPIYRYRTKIITSTAKKRMSTWLKSLVGCDRVKKNTHFVYRNPNLSQKKLCSNLSVLKIARAKIS
jgi:hypothetical protein